MAAGWLRTPTLHGDRVAFCSEDDLWSVPLSGGIARRLTTGLGACARPRFSPDGTLLAFDGTEEGVREVYVVDAEGGSLRRLTWQGDTANVVGWSPAGEVLFVSPVGQPFPRDTHAHTLPASGGVAERLPFGPIAGMAWDPDGRVALCRHAADLAWWKGYRGGRMGVLWVRDGDGDPFRPLTIHANVSNPMWIGDRLWFVADPDGVPQLHSARVAGGEVTDLRAHTSHADLAVRYPATDGATIVYCHGGDLYRLDPRSDAEPVRIDVDLRSQRTELQRRFSQSARNLEAWDLHPEGHSLALVVRGRPLVMGHWEGPVTQLGVRDGVRYGLARWIDGERLIVTSDAGGEQALEILRVDGHEGRRFDGLDHGRTTELEVDPTGHRVAFTDHRHALYVLDLATGDLRVIDRSRSGPIAGFDWSSDGRWLTWARPEGPGHHRSRIRLCDVREGGEPVDVTNGWYQDVSPSFDPDGQYLYLLSYREFDPVADTQYSGYAFPRGMRPYLIPLLDEAGDPFRPAPRPLKSPSRSDRGALDIDLEGIGDRLVPFPIPEGRFEQIIGVGSGQVLLTRTPVRGLLDRTWFDPGPPRADNQLLVWEFERQELTELNGRVSSFRVDRKRDHLAVRSGAKLRVTWSRPDKSQRDELRKTEGRTDRKAGWIDLGRARVSVDPAVEWAQMLREAWRLMRDHYWSPGLNGVDWNAVWERYRALLPRVGSRGELSDLVWCMQGELGTSHAYEMGGDYVTAPSWRIGRLGGDFAWDPAAEGWRITRIVRGEPGDPERSSPLRAPGLRLAEGDLLTHVAGVRLSASVPPEIPLVNQSGSSVAVGVTTAEGPRDVVVRTLADDRGLRYRDWVLENQRRTHAVSDGRIGYVHVPDMGTPGFAEFHRDFQRESERDALLVDVRHNRGGHVSQMLLDRLGRKRLGYKVARWIDPTPYPAYTIPGPMLALTNEMAGSDGDIFSHAWKRLGLGPLVGTRTWGGVVGIWPRQLLIDRGVTTQPEYATWFDDVGFGIENYGTDPDVVVDRAPEEWSSGRDGQLERAWAILLQLLAENPPGPVAP